MMSPAFLYRSPGEPPARTLCKAMHRKETFLLAVCILRRILCGQQQLGESKASYTPPTLKKWIGFVSQCNVYANQLHAFFLALKRSGKNSVGVLASFLSPALF